MSVPILDIINNISFVGWAITGGSFAAMLVSSIVFWQDVSKRSSKFFLFLGVALFLWGLSYSYFEGSLGTPNIQDGVTLLYTVAALVPVFLFLFLLVFSIEDVRISFWRFVLLFVPYLMIVGVLKFAPEFIASYKGGNSGEAGSIALGKGFLVYAFYILGFIIAGVVVLWRKYRESAGIFRTAIGGLLLAVCFACFVAVVTALFAPLIFVGHDLFWIAHTAVILMLFAVTLTLTKYNFWNIKVMGTELLILVIILVLIAQLFIASSPGDLIIKMGITVLIVFSGSFLVGSVKREILSKERISQLMHDLDLMSKHLKVLDKKKSEFLSIASHHLRDPLTAIKGYASMLSEGSFGELSRPVKEAVDKIYESSIRLITMISDFMDISRIESGDMNYTFTDVDLKKMILDIAGDMKQHADRAHLTLDAVVEGGSSDQSSFITVADAGKLRQVFSNLIDNSIKYTPQGGVTIRLSKSEGGRKILFTLSDTGIGMNEATKEKIFKKFSRADGVSKVYTEGTGLGLYVAMEVIKKHEGRIWADSKGEGLGSSFYVELEAKK